MIRSGTNKIVTFKLNDYVKLPHARIGKIEGIFTHQLLKKNFLFAVITLADGNFPDIGITAALRDSETGDASTKDPILRTPIFRMSDEQIIVGLPQIGSQRIWVVPGLEEGELWYIDWEIYFM